MSQGEQSGKPRLYGIAGVTDTLRPIIVGKAKIGQKVYSEKAGKEIPSKLDHIRFVDHEGNKIEAVHDILGEEPKDFVCIFHSDNPNDFWWPSYRLWKGGGGGQPGMLACHGDGREAVVKETGEVIECNPKSCPSAVKGDCQPTGSLTFLIPEIPSIGCFQIDTRGLASIRNFQYAVNVIGSITGGRYMGFLVKISVYKFRGAKGMSYAWRADVLGTPGQVQLAAASREPQQLLPAELQFDESRPEPEAMPAETPAAGGEPAQAAQEAQPAGDEAKQETPPAPGMSHDELRRLAWTRAKVLGWDGARTKAGFDVFLAEHEGDIEPATEALLAHIEDVISAIKVTKEELDWNDQFISEQQEKFRGAEYEPTKNSEIEADRAFVAQVNHDLQIQTELLTDD